MRIRTVVSIASLLLPCTAIAQQFPRPGTRRPPPTQPAPLPRQPEPIARQTEYRRLRISVESYPMVSYIHSPGFSGDGRTSAWTAFGGGTRAEYQFTRLMSATLDLTSSFAGSPALINTAELGTRIRPERSEQRLDPFIDLRIGYISATNREFSSVLDDPFGVPLQQTRYGSNYSNGFGGIAGVGAEYWLTRSLSLTTVASAMRSQMTSRDFSLAQNIDRSYAMTAFRYSIGIKYTPVRSIRTTNNPQ